MESGKPPDVVMTTAPNGPTVGRADAARSTGRPREWRDGDAELSGRPIAVVLALVVRTDRDGIGR